MTTQQQPPNDPAQTAKVFAEVAERSSKILGDFVKRHADGKGIAFTDEFGLAKAFMICRRRCSPTPGSSPRPR